MQILQIFKEMKMLGEAELQTTDRFEHHIVANACRWEGEFGHPRERFELATEFSRRI